MQYTVSDVVTFSGKGLHTGAPVRMEIHPAHGDNGIIFRRIDLPGEPEIPALAEYVSTTKRGTTITKDAVSVSTIEHITATLFALGIDNAIIKVNGPEIPIMDGSAREFAEKVLKVGIKELKNPRRSYTPSRVIHYKDEHSGAEITVTPSKEFSIDLQIDFNSDIIGKQKARFDKTSDFLKEIAPCRTFVFLEDVMPLLKCNLIKGGDIDNAIVIAEKDIPKDERIYLKSAYPKIFTNDIKKGYINASGLRCEDECVRHKLLDIIGDLSLVGVSINARIEANKSGHSINTIVARIMRNDLMESGDIPQYDPNKEPVVDINGIKKLLPHRPPFLMVDRISEMSENAVVGIKTIGINEGYFIGHFPDEPVMPGVLILETMAQVGGILVLNGVDEPEKYSTYFAKIDKVKFKKKVVPGDVLVIKMVLTQPLRRSIVCMRGEVYVGNTMVCEGEMIAQVIKNK
ncbi:MAG: bifunctional UDP-3-O-[3-hydroxymyristoyl] N-acetylglucosamine deacetylase/3-hydroxyacyl-ACP dehydratase [Rikenellaceae bacterium]|nr:bifunctional UDP-3-O-[3-hydroxymyristoyl] N-acetylglucosamine deacetylase/3-hydroxyacyl-ACP dehydratase [Rikenellaceae bacterium]